LNRRWSGIINGQRLPGPNVDSGLRGYLMRLSIQEESTYAVILVAIEMFQEVEDLVRLTIAQAW